MKFGKKVLGLKFEVLGLICPRLVHVQLLLQKKKQYDSAEIYVGANDLLI